MICNQVVCGKSPQLTEPNSCKENGSVHTPRFKIWNAFQINFYLTKIQTTTELRIYFVILCKEDGDVFAHLHGGGIFFFNFKIVHILYQENLKSVVIHRFILKITMIPTPRCNHHYHFNYIFPIFALSSYTYFSVCKIRIIIICILFATFAF